jgi:hypothetical protein
MQWLARPQRPIYKGRILFDRLVYTKPINSYKYPGLHNQKANRHYLYARPVQCCLGMFPTIIKYLSNSMLATSATNYATAYYKIIHDAGVGLCCVLIFSVAEKERFGPQAKGVYKYAEEDGYFSAQAE